MAHSDEKNGAAPVAALLNELREIHAPSVPACAHAAVVIDAGGGVHRGTTIRSITPGLGVCATRVALARSRCGDGGKVTLVVALSANRVPQLCGLCRQFLAELAPGARVFVAGESGPAQETDGLLPNAFGPDAIEESR